MKLSAIIEPMIAAGVSGEVILATVRAFEAQQDGAIEQRRANDRERQHRRRHVMSRDVTVTQRDTVSPKKETSPTPPKEKTTPSSVSEPEGSSTESAREFSEFWTMFPNKVGKRDAEKAFASARKRTGLDAILSGLRRYATKTDDRPWCNPATFLNQNRWEDQPAAPPPRQATSPPRNDLDRMNDALNSLISGRSHEPDEPSNTIDASFERGDRRGAEDPFQRPSFPARH